MSAGGDPFIALFALKLFKERWYNEVDKFYICYNNNCNVPQDVVDEFREAVKDPKVVLLYFPNGIGNGKPIEMMAKVATEDLVMLLEDDGFIFTPGIVDKCFKQIESGEVDAVGSPRFACGFEVSELLKKKYNLDYSGSGDRGPNYWPNFFFCKRKDLLKTDLDFASYTFYKGKFYPELGGTITKDGEYGDTFVWTCIQMRFLGVRFGSVEQKHASPYEFDDKLNSKGNWVSPIPWIHGGSLSTSWGGYLSGMMPNFTDDYGKQEIETRVAFWTICAQEIKGFGAFKYQYAVGIEKLIENAKLNEDRINLKIDIYKELMKI
jgi:hypothetical protein